MRTTLSLFAPGFASSGAGSAVHALVEGIVRIARAPFRFYAARAELTKLAALSDHELCDIGLTRTDIATATALPIEIDPTTALASVVRDRRAYRPHI